MPPNKMGQNQAINLGAKDKKSKRNGGLIFQKGALFVGFLFQSCWWLESPHGGGAGNLLKDIMGFRVCNFWKK